MGLLGNLRLAFQANGAADALVKEAKTNMDWKKPLLKGLRDFIVTTGAVALAAGLTYLTSTDNLTLALAGFPVALKAALIPIISAAAVMGLNALKHGGKG